MKKTKILSLLLAICLCFFTLAGCIMGDKDTDEISDTGDKNDDNNENDNTGNEDDNSCVIFDTVYDHYLCVYPEYSFLIAQLDNISENIYEEAGGAKFLVADFTVINTFNDKWAIGDVIQVPIIVSRYNSTSEEFSLSKNVIESFLINADSFLLYTKDISRCDLLLNGESSCRLKGECNHTVQISLSAKEIIPIKNGKLDRISLSKAINKMEGNEITIDDSYTVSDSPRYINQYFPHNLDVSILEENIQKLFSDGIKYEEMRDKN